MIDQSALSEFPLPQEVLEGWANLAYLQPEGGLIRASCAELCSVHGLPSPLMHDNGQYNAVAHRVCK